MLCSELAAELEEVVVADLCARFASSFLPRQPASTLLDFSSLRRLVLTGRVTHPLPGQARARRSQLPRSASAVSSSTMTNAPGTMYSGNVLLQMSAQILNASRVSNHERRTYATRRFSPRNILPRYKQPSPSLGRIVQVVLRSPRARSGSRGSSPGDRLRPRYSTVPSDRQRPQVSRFVHTRLRLPHPNGSCTNPLGGPAPACQDSPRASPHATDVRSSSPRRTDGDEPPLGVEDVDLCVRDPADQWGGTKAIALDSRAVSMP